MDSTPLIELWNLSKLFPGVIANDNVSFDIKKGEIVALLGENGAGKSTLVKMIYGVNRPDDGAILWENKEVSIRSPNQARALGIGMVFQHFSVFETLTVKENIALGLDKEFLRDIEDLSACINTISQKYDLHVDPDRYVHSLSIGERQRVEIVRCLIQDVKLLILDEPTSVLTPLEVAGLFRVLRQLASEGSSILFISHKLNEVTELCDRAVILRGGKVSGHCNPKQETSASIARMMVGDEAEITTSFTKKHAQHELLRTHQLTLAASHPFGCGLTDVNLSIKQGEIIGIAGVAGNGQDDLLEALSGEDARIPNESIVFMDAQIGQLDPHQRRLKGITHVPTNRLGQGAVPEMSLIDNTLLTNSHRFIRFGLIAKKSLKALTQTLIKRHQVKCSGDTAQAKSLSGGNLQKFIIGREIEQTPKLLLCAHPTWGVDIAAASAIHRNLIALRDAGSSVLVVSEDIDELYMICDRIGALYEGQLSPIEPVDKLNKETIGQWMAGAFVERKDIAHA
ncbi:ABC transporter ATP-binding protein [Vibrio ulleungensis]|uniref:ABC transporter ATP-binding protein n=1 Tax=Vibrio ulleungensis TaxID=2807619 RepID=A0ABS2HIV3_9VIBR|nr:ABC transporter ATP-binding protein [Vibrio ulleungensis]MBM7036032.1 ABC transporter ATP-binding protein [Vibrio ulleungensis]